LHNAGKTIVVKRHLTDEFEKKYEHIGFLGFLKSRTEPDWTETGRFDSVSVVFFQKKNRFGCFL
jgi:GTPase SAR1 family protein